MIFGLRRSRVIKLCALLLSGTIVAIFVISFYARDEFDRNWQKMRDSKLKSQRNPNIAQYRFDRYNMRDQPDTRPGAMGKGHDLKLSGDEKKHEIDVMNKEGVNILVNREIPINRSLPDSRLPECKRIDYDFETLPSAAVVTIFYNEDFRILMRTVSSVINRSPPELLKEVILVDDFSDREELTGTKLDDFVKKEWPDGAVKVVHLKERSGLMVARTTGAQVATAEVVIFMDAHSEAGEGWLEPLLQRIKQKPTAILTPVVNDIKAEDLSINFHYVPDIYFGTFGYFEIDFDWMKIPEREKRRRKFRTEPIMSPTLIGCFIAANKEFFFKIGSFDMGMKYVSAENIELSFRTWMCGGSIEIIPCSQAAHLWRRHHTYTQPKGEYFHNPVRVAEALMDDYKRYFYWHHPDHNATNGEDISSRLQLRKDLQCKSFRWYLDNIHPEKFLFDDHAMGYGYVMNKVGGKHLCLEMAGPRRHSKAVNLQLSNCKKKRDMKQFFSLSLWNELRQEITCAYLPDGRGDSSSVMMDCCTRQANDVPSKPREIWQYDPSNGRLINKGFNRCITSKGVQPGQRVEAVSCDENDPHQVWKFETWKSVVHNITFPNYLT